jgi:hypothetical protein
MLLLLSRVMILRLTVTLSFLLLSGILTAGSFAQVAQGAKNDTCGDGAQVIEAEIKLQAVKRKLSDYEKLAPVCVALADTHDHDTLPRVRDFIWRHWEERRRGFAVVTFYSIEGAPSTFFIFIEPGAKARWHIATKIDRILFYWDTRQSRRRTDGFTAYSVERVASGDRRDTYRLVFRDARKGRITEF